MDQETINNISNIYKGNNYKKGNLYEKVKAVHPELRPRRVKAFLNQDYTTQLTQTKQNQEAKGHIVATSPNELWQFDILDLSRYAKRNDNTRYILACVDVFTRKAYVEPMKLKNSENVEVAFKSILERAHAKPQSLLSDQDSAFLNGTFKDYVAKENIFLSTNALRDHHALGIIDNFAYRIKNILTKGFLNEKNVEWLSKIQGIVNQYNNDNNAGVGGFKPNDAGKETLPTEEKAPTKGPEKPEDKKQRELRNEVRMSPYQEVLNMNLEKRKDNNQIASLAIDDNVRISTMGRSALQKGTDPKWSDEVLQVTNVKGNTITLSNEKAYSRNDLLKVPAGSQNVTNKNAIDKAKAELMNKLHSRKATVKKLLKSALTSKKKKEGKEAPAPKRRAIVPEQPPPPPPPAPAPKAKATRAEQFALLRQIALNKRNS